MDKVLSLPVQVVMRLSDQIYEDSANSLLQLSVLAPNDGGAVRAHEARLVVVRAVNVARDQYKLIWCSEKQPDSDGGAI